MKLLVVCLLFGAVLALSKAGETVDKQKDKQITELESVDEGELSEGELAEDELNEKDITEAESVDETELMEDDPDNGEQVDIAKPESVDETELSDAEDYRSLRRCRRGFWCKYRGRYYTYIRSPRRWAYAQRYCLRIRGTLARIPNRRVNRFLSRLAKGRLAWIGASDAQLNGVWLWINGGRHVYSRWCRGQPDNAYGGQDCAVINFSAGGCWDDQHCQARHPFICQRKK